MVGFLQQCPLLKFLGRGNLISDLYGEKLAEAHIGLILRQLFADILPAPVFMMLAPNSEQPPTGYTLFLAGASRPLASELDALATVLDHLLRENVHYDYCRRLGQLHQAEIYWISDAQHAMQVYQRVCLSRGQRLGDIKSAVLDRDSGWQAYFDE